MRHEEEVDLALSAITSGSCAGDQETGTLEIKQQAKSNDKAIADIVEASLCLANASGGSVVVGLSNTLHGRAAFLGSDLNEGIVRRSVYDLTRPHLTVDLSV